MLSVYFDFIILQNYFLLMEYFYPICYVKYSLLSFENFLYLFIHSINTSDWRDLHVDILKIMSSTADAVCKAMFSSEYYIMQESRYF